MLLFFYTRDHAASPVLVLPQEVAVKCLTPASPGGWVGVPGA